MQVVQFGYAPIEPVRSWSDKASARSKSNYFSLSYHTEPPKHELVGVVSRRQKMVPTFLRAAPVTLPFRNQPDTVGEVSVAGLWSVEKVSSPEAAHVAPFATSAACP